MHQPIGPPMALDQVVGGHTSRAGPQLRRVVGARFIKGAAHGQLRLVVRENPGVWDQNAAGRQGGLISPAAKGGTAQPR